MERDYRICKKCIMDTSAPISFDENGICNYCHEYDEKVKKRVLKGEEGKKKIEEIIENIKQKGKSQKYDCIVGVSGGVDSTYVAYLAKKWGLRPLAVHLDNGWNTKKATQNIARILKKLDIDLYTYVIDWEEFKDLQLSFLKASVLDTELVTDQAIKAALYQTAAKNNIKYILSGVNLVTEGVMPRQWGHYKGDYINLLDIHNKFGSVKLKTYPILTLSQRFNYQIIKNIQTIEVLNYIPYNREEAKNIIINELGWEDYKYKHHESMFTRFFQTYILPKKFNIDKRRPHLSAFVCAGLMTREEALKEIELPSYPEDEMKRDKEYVIKKLGLTEREFENIMALPPKKHTDYKSGIKMLSFSRALYKKLLNR